MSDKQQPDSQRKPCANKNIKKLRTINMVCGLMSSWQQWAADNQKKQASEPSGWSPSSLGGPTEESRMTWVPKNRPPAQRQPTSPEESKKAASNKETPNVSKRSAEPPAGSGIRTKQVAKTVTGGVQEKSAGIDLLTQKLKKETLPSGEEIDRLLRKKSSPTRRRKCSNVVSSLTKSWKQVEDEQKLGKDGGGPGEEDSGRSETEKDKQEVEDAQPGRTSFLKDTADSELGVRIKRSTVSS